MIYTSKSKSNWNYDSYLTYSDFRNSSNRYTNSENTASYNNCAYGGGFKVLHLLNGTQERGLLAAYIGLDYLHLTQDAYNESGTNINVNKAEMNLLRSPIGLIWTRTYEQRNGTKITPELGVAYVFNLGDHYADLQYYTHGATTPEHAYSQNLGRGTTKLSAGIKTTFTKTLALLIRYDWETLNENDSFLFQLKYKF